VRVTDLMGAPSLSGLLRGASINVQLMATSGFAYADDLCVYVDVEPFSTGGLLQIGGFTDLNATQRYFWPNGGSSVVGTTSIGSVQLTSPLAFSSNPGASPRSIWIGNGWGGADSSGTWTGSITLHGVSLVPAPGGLALLALAGGARRNRGRACVAHGPSGIGGRA
jgi:hypothetical protein